MELVKTIAVTPDAETTLMYIARVSNPNNQTSGNPRLIRYCIDNKHWSIFEHAYMTLELNTSRAISAQVLRHRSFTFQEFSQRYAAIDETGVCYYVARRNDPKNRQNSFDDLSDEIKTEWEHRQLDNWKRAFEHYKWALDNGIAKECARMVLPLQTATRMYMTGNVRDWIFYIMVRTDPTAQLEHRILADKVKIEFKKNFPIVSAALGWIGDKG